MHVDELKTAAPMPKKEEVIAKNSMKLYSYLVCLSGLARYPENTRMFRQSDMMLSCISKTIGLDPKTIKYYLYLLEKQGLVKFQGIHRFLSEIEIIEGREEKNNEEPKITNAQIKKMVFDVWKKRNKEEKNAVYYIPRPVPYTPVPEETLEVLNTVFNATEMEIKIYLFCCVYRDECVQRGLAFKFLTLQQLRDVLGVVLHHETDANIRRALIFLRGMGLIDFVLTNSCNRKGAPIEGFKLTEVNYYVAQGYDVSNASSSEWLDEETLSRLKEGYSKAKEQ